MDARGAIYAIDQFAIIHTKHNYNDNNSNDNNDNSNNINNGFLWAPVRGPLIISLYVSRRSEPGFLPLCVICCIIAIISIILLLILILLLVLLL